jgi:hypothetical protein
MPSGFDGVQKQLRVVESRVLDVTHPRGRSVPIRLRNSGRNSAEFEDELPVFQNVFRNDGQYLALNL